MYLYQLVRHKKRSCLLSIVNYTTYLFYEVPNQTYNNIHVFSNILFHQISLDYPIDMTQKTQHDTTQHKNDTTRHNTTQKDTKWIYII